MSWHTTGTHNLVQGCGSVAIKFGIGSYEHTQPGAPSTIEARITFLVLVEEVEPQVVVSLHDGLFPLFLCSIYLHFQSRIEADKPLEAQTVVEAIRNLRKHITAEEVKDLLPSWEGLTKVTVGAGLLVNHLKEWAQSWQLDETWCLDYATRTLRMWLFRDFQRHPPSWRNAELSLSADESSLMSNAIWDNISIREVNQFYKEAYGEDESKHGFHFEYQEFSFKSSGWSPFYQGIGEWKNKVTEEFLSRLDLFRMKYNRIPKGIKQAFKQHTKEHVDILRSATLRLGFKPAPKKWDFKHFRWLIYYQVQKPNWSYERIAKEHRTDIKAVSSGIKRTAKLIGLKVRPPLPAGRKPRAARPAASGNKSSL